MKKRVIVAPVPAEIIASASGVPELYERVAFGSNKEGLDTFPIGADVYVYASKSDENRNAIKPHPLWQQGVVTWGGTLSAIVRAVERGRRSGKHPKPAVRPPFAEEGDTPVTHFWEVKNLHCLERPIPFSKFKDTKGKPAFKDSWPQWPRVLFLQDTE